MDLKHLSDKDLLAQTSRYVREEKEVLVKLLWHFKEIDRRRLFCDEKSPSLYQYLVSKFGYSEDAAYARIAAMRVLADLPEIEVKINQGELNLSNLNVAKEVFRKKEMSTEQKLEFIEKISNTSAREAEKIKHAELDTKYEKPEKITTVTDSRIEIRFSADSSLIEKIEMLKGLWAHKDPYLSLEKLFTELCELGIESWRKSGTSRKPCVKPSAAETKREVFQEAEDRCTNCGSVFATQTDHIIPRAKGGPNQKENLRVLCRACNQRAAIKEFGQIKMDLYL